MSIDQRSYLAKGELFEKIRLLPGANGAQGPQGWGRCLI